MYPSWQNNSQSIIREYKEAFDRCPCDFHAKQLENVGVVVDFDSKDWGNDAHEIPAPSETEIEYDVVADIDLAKYL